MYLKVTFKHIIYFYSLLKLIFYFQQNIKPTSTNGNMNNMIF